MIKLNPVNRLKPMELGVQKGAKENFDKAFDEMTNTIKAVKLKFRADSDLTTHLDDALYQMGSMKNGELGKGVFTNLRNSLRAAKARPDVREQEKALLNKAEAKLNSAAAPLKNNKTQYSTESNYTLQGGKDYKETIFYLDEPIKSNSI